jgi:hypothetical protein
MKRRRKINHPPGQKPNLRQQLLNEMKDRYPYYVLKSSLLSGLFLLGMILTIWEIQIYEVTIIPLFIPLSIWLLTGLIITPFFKKTFNIYCFNPYSPGKTPVALHIVSNVASFGGILLFLFMWTNQYFANPEKSTVTAGIIQYGHFAKTANGCGNPWVHIIYLRREKELVFPCGTDVEKYNSVYLEVKKGFFGFDVITNKTLEEGRW